MRRLNQVSMAKNKRWIISNLHSSFGDVESGPCLRAHWDTQDSQQVPDVHTSASSIAFQIKDIFNGQ
nr:hypothetical protein [Tanacetum cinerariifolium]